jgi:hypothetical protein
MKICFYLYHMKQTQTPNTMTIEQYNFLCEDFSKKQEMLTKWCESSTQERKKLSSYKVLRKEAHTAMLKLESWINDNK